MAKLNSDRDVKPELAVVNGRMEHENWQLREGAKGWMLINSTDGRTIIEGTLREVFSFIMGAKYITEGSR